jgi:hypothetical protein
MYTFELSLRTALEANKFIRDSMFKRYCEWTSTNTFIVNEQFVMEDLEIEFELRGIEFSISL